MDQEVLIALTRLSYALLAGGIIGLERAYHGRPAGFRTHTLVCLASTLLMLLMVFQWDLIPAIHMDKVRVDPARMAQGIMTGIGFLGAGVILREKQTIRGLTTAASIWMTASIGVMLGLGFVKIGMIATAFTLGTLGVFRWIEYLVPSYKYASLSLRFAAFNIMKEEDLSKLLESFHISGAQMSYKLTEDGNIFQYEMNIRSLDLRNFRLLADHLRVTEVTKEFSIRPIGD